MNQLAEQLHELCVTANRRFAEAKAAGKVGYLERLEQREVYTELTYPGGSSYRTEARITRTPHPLHIHALAKACAAEHPELQLDLPKSSAGNGTTENDAVYFAQAYLIRCGVDGQEVWARPERITSFVATFLADRAGSPVEMTARLWLDGITVGDAPLQFDKFTLRRPVLGDVNTSAVKHSVTTILEPYTISFQPEHAIRVIPKAILETTQSATAPEEVLADVQRVALLLGLVGTGYVHTIRHECWPNRISRSAFSSEPVDGFEKHVLGSFAAEPSIGVDVGKLCALGMERLPKRAGEFPRDEALWPVWIGFAKLHDAETGFMTPTQAKISSAVSGLEALLLKQDERTELAGRLSLRTAILMAGFGLSGSKVSSTMRRAYRARSEFVHGAPASEPVKPTLLRDVLVYLRAALLLALQWSKEKGALIKKLDNAALEPRARDKLFKELQALPVVPTPLQSGDARS